MTKDPRHQDATPPRPVDAERVEDPGRLATEQHLLMPDRAGRSYAGGHQPLDIDLPEMTWREAKAAFLARYEEVRP